MRMLLLPSMLWGLCLIGTGEALQATHHFATKARLQPTSTSTITNRGLDHVRSVSDFSTRLYASVDDAKQGQEHGGDGLILDAEIIDNKNAATASLFPQNNNKNNPQALRQRVQARLQQWMRSIMTIFRKLWQWQRTKGKRFMASAALAMSVFLATHQALPPLTTNTMSATPTRIERVVGATTTTTDDASLALMRGGSRDSTKTTLETVEKVTSRTLKDAAMDLGEYMTGPKSDTLLLLLATALITPICKRLGTSPILGFLASGMLLGPNGCGLISGIHTTETLAELGIVFFLFEMGIELSVERLMQMRKDVFGLGLGQFGLTALAVAGFGSLFGLPGNALVVLGGGLALSSSAFVLQLLKDKDQLATRFGKASFGILLFQDLAVVPLLVVTPLLAGSGSGLARALGAATVKAFMALGSIAVAGRYLLNPLFRLVAQAQSQEAFLGVVLLTVLSMSFMTEGLGLSNTLGAFLAGVLLSETKYRYQVEADIAPFRGILLGLFFVTVGFEIDLSLIAAKLPLVAGLVAGILATKAAVTTALSLAFGLSLPNSLQTGLMLSQGGEFAFVAFGLARSLGILDPATTKLMLTSVSLTMALTPFMASVGGKIAKKLEEQTDFTHYLGQDRDASEIKESEDFAVVVGYGAVGKIVCNLLDEKLIKYVGLDTDPNKAIQARNKGLPVFYGDIARQEVADAFNVGKAKMVIVCISDRAQANRALIALRRFYPDLRIFARAVDADHASRLQNTLNVAAMVPILPEDNLLLTLPFGGAVMKALGVSPQEVNSILENKRKAVLQGRGLDEAEEEAALVQLGIQVKKANAIAVELASMSTNATKVSDEDVWDDDDEDDEWDKAAAERRKEAMEKSPFVAEVIEANCPGIADVDKNQNSTDMAEQLKETAEQLLQPEVLAEGTIEDREAISKNETNAFQ
uniref:RCK N-terminal domain-containing protein n=1 Tax=Amphora coffeiformis TaxID=265554 RepID=A0A7S3L4P7_9STRA